MWLEGFSEEAVFIINMPDFTNGAATGFVLEFPNHLLVHGAVENMLFRVISRVKLLQVWLDVSVEIIGEDLIAKAVGIGEEEL